MRRRTLIACLAASLVAVIVPDVVVAQVDGYHITGINFNFANPGARARGIGGAFVALADDATAALANPAGLAYLDRQFSLELMHDEERTLVGQTTQEVTIAGVPPVFTAETDASRVRAESDTDRINFGSFVFPVRKWNVGLAVYYAALADLEQDYSIDSSLACVDGSGTGFVPTAGQQCSVFSPIADPPTSLELWAPQTVSARLETRLAGVGLGWKLSDAFSIGVSIAYAETTFTGTAIEDIPEDSPFPPETQESVIDDEDYMYSLGLLYRATIWGLGLSYRSETEFDIENTRVIEGDTTPFPGKFRIPERIAGGVAFFPSDRWVIAGEYVHLPYSVMPEGMPVQFDEDRETAGVDYAMSDVDEYHIGAEYTTFSDRKGWSVRAGYWREQSHLVYSSQGYSEPIGEDLDNRTRAAAALLYEELALDIDHFTAGFGAAFGVFRLDAAVDYSDEAGTDVLLSGVIYF